MQTRMRMSFAVAAAAALLGGVVAALAEDAPKTAEAAGMVLTTLSPADLDTLEKATGHRLGVQVTAVKADSPAAAAGVKVGDVIFAVGTTGVDSAEKAAAALRGAAGDVLLTVASQATGEWKAVQYTLKLGPAAPGGGGAPVVPPGGPAEPAGLGDPISAYFDMLDFTRTQAWGRPCATPTPERERVAGLVLAGWNQLGAAGQATIMQIPQVWESVRQQWAGADEARKKDLVQAWGRNLLLPNMLYPPPTALQAYRSPGGEVALQYPAGWVVAQQQVAGVPMLALAPPGTETTWEKMLDAPNSPPGALLALVQKDAQLAALPGYAAGVRLLAQLLFKEGLAGFKEIGVIDLGNQGAVITYLGRFPGQQEDKFYWMGAVPFGSSAIVVGRFGGPVAQAEQLVPALHHILGSLKLTPPRPAGGGVQGTWDAAWSRVGVAITKSIWAPSGH